jgi:hypothetical protein
LEIAMKLVKLTFLALGLLFGGAALAADFSFTGNLADHNQVQLFNFSVAAPSTVTLRTYSYAGGVNAAGQTILRGGFDPILALFDSSGALINQNDDGGSNVPADSVTGTHYDTFLQSSLTAGNYTVSVMDYANFANGPNLSNGFSNGALSPGFIDATGNQRDNHWAFDVLNVNSAVVVPPINAVPEPESYAMMLAGLGLLGFIARRRKTRA